MMKNQIKKQYKKIFNVTISVTNTYKTISFYLKSV